MREKSSRIAYLESIRGIAAFVVVLSHLANSFYPAAINGASASTHSKFDVLFFTTPLSILIAGNFAVCIFFVLSGFVLSIGLFSRYSQERLLSAVVKRYFRLFFMILASCLIAYVLLKFGGFFNQQTSEITGSLLLQQIWNFPANIEDLIRQVIFGIYAGNDTTYNPVLWTMHIEFVGSLFVYGILSLFGRHPVRYIAYVVACALLWNTYYPCFFVGMLLADLYHNREFIKKFLHNRFSVTTTVFRYRPVIAGILVVSGLFLGGYTFDSTAPTIYSPFYIEGLSYDLSSVINHSIGAALLMSGVLLLGRSRAILELKPFVWLGRVSFSLYAIHLIIIASLGSLIFNALITGGQTYLTSVIIASAASIIATLIASELLTRKIDKPSILFSNMIGAKVTNYNYDKDV